MGLDGDEAALGIRDLRSLVDCIRLVRRTAMQTVVRAVTTAVKDAPYSTMEELADYSQDNKVVLGHYRNFLIPTQVTKAHALRAGDADLRS